jgi:hypothetical protein
MEGREMAVSFSLDINAEHFEIENFGSNDTLHTMYDTHIMEAQDK